MSKWKIIPFLLVIVAALFLAGCQPNDGEPELSDSLPMELESEFPFPFIDVAAYSGEPIPGDIALATSVPPYYVILDGYLMSCLGQDFIVLQVKNLSGWTFQYLTMGASNGVEAWYLWPKDYMPFHHAGNECPKAPPFSHLAPGETAFLYLQVEHTWGNNTYNIWLNMCTYVGDPPSDAESCMLRNYVLTVDEPPFRLIYFEAIKEWLCWEGPGPRFPVIGAIFPGEAVQFYALAEDDLMLVVMHPKYGRMCWTNEDVFEIKDPRLFEGQNKEPSPDLPPECPPNFKYDYELGECVKKENDCRSIKSQKLCDANPNCWWDPAVGECY